MKIIMKYTTNIKRGKKRTFFKKKINKLFFFYISNCENSNIKRRLIKIYFLKGI
jgi:hypothetical protein